MKVQTIDIEQFKDCVIIKVSQSKWGNAAKVKNADKVKAYFTQREQEMANVSPEERATAQAPAITRAGGGTGSVSITVKLIASKPLENLISRMNEVKASVCGQFGIAAPSRISEGLFLLNKLQIPEAERRLKAGWEDITANFLPAAVEDYTAAIDRAREFPIIKGGLGPLFDVRNYVSAEEFANSFKIGWQWLAFGVPADLPEELRAKAQADMKEQMSQAAEEVKLALREGFRDLLAHAVDKLTVEPGEKKKTFRDSLVGNIQSFFECFQARNLLGDSELENLVSKAREVIGEGNTMITPQRLRDSQLTRDQTRNRFAEIKSKLDGMIAETASRSIELDDEPAEVAA